jgi:hypothetical protein
LPVYGALPIEAVVEPDLVGNDLRWESVALIGIHLPILPKSGNLLGHTDMATTFTSEQDIDIRNKYRAF